MKQPGSTSALKLMLFWPAALVVGLNRATDKGTLPWWLPRVLLVALVAWIIFLFVWGLAAG